MALTQRAASAAYRLGWLVVRRVPESWARRVFRQIADILWRRQGKGVQQLEANLRRVVPGATGKQLCELSRAGMRSYLRYFMEAFRLPVMPRERIVSGMYVAGEEQTALTHLRAGRGVIFALPHSGNIDLAAAWIMTRGAGPVSTVAERLKPESLCPAVECLVVHRAPAEIREHRLCLRRHVCSAQELPLRRRGCRTTQGS